MEKQLTVNFKTKGVNLLSICRSYRRPQMLKEMLDSFDKTKSDGTEMIIYLSTDDPMLNEYENVVKGRNLFVDDHKYLAPSINHMTMNILPNIPYYQTICDDHIYHTVGWDKIMIDEVKASNDWGVVGAGDFFSKAEWARNESHVSAEIYSGKLVRLLKGLYHEKIRHFGCDMYLEKFLLPIGLILYAENAKIEHRCWNAYKKGTNDANQQFVYHQTEQKYFYDFLNKWIQEDKVKTQRMVLQAMRIK